MHSALPIEKLTNANRTQIKPKCNGIESNQKKEKTKDTNYTTLRNIPNKIARRCTHEHVRQRRKHRTRKKVQSIQNPRNNVHSGRN